MGTTQECYELSWTNPWSNPPWNGNSMATYLPSQKSSKMSKTYRTLLEKQGLTHKWHSSMDSYTWICQCWLTSKNFFLHQFCVDVGCCLEDLPGAMDDRERWWERNLCCQHNLMMMMIHLEMKVKQLYRVDGKVHRLMSFDQWNPTTAILM